MIVCSKNASGILEFSCEQYTIFYRICFVSCMMCTDVIELEHEIEGTCMNLTMLCAFMSK